MSKLKLSDLKINSFITSFDQIKGGYTSRYQSGNTIIIYPTSPEICPPDPQETELCALRTIFDRDC